MSGRKSSSGDTARATGDTQRDHADIPAQMGALSEILRVIAASRDDEAPVFKAILENAKTLCAAHMAGLILGRAEDETQQLAASLNIQPNVVEMFDTGQMKMDPNLSYAARCIAEGRLIAFADMGESDLYRAGSPIVRAMVDVSNIRSVLFVPLLSNGTAIGLITLFRAQIDPFDDEEITLVEGFAAQAVIAIENARQFRALQTRLERERASTEILDVISQCRDDEAPVFDTVLRQARTLCNASTATLVLGTPQDRFLDLVAVSDAEPDSSVSNAHRMRASREPMEMDPDAHFAAYAICTGRVFNVADLREPPMYRDGVPATRYSVDVVGQRATLSVPLCDATGAVGAINLHRRDTTPFADDEVALVKSFAA